MGPVRPSGESTLAQARLHSEGGLHFSDPVERKWWILLASCIAIFMLLLDVTIVNVALPST
jgi:hypothetical protein